jgi:hypothetical protein
MPLTMPIYAESVRGKKANSLDSGLRRNGAPVSVLNERGASPLQVYATACNRL